MGSQISRQHVLTGLLVSMLIAVIGWQLLKWWTRPAAVEFDNLKYIQLLTTAVSYRSAEMVDKVETAIRQRFDSEQMSEAEFDHFQSLIALAHDEKWELADRECFEFAEAQLSRSRRRPPSTDDGHEHLRPPAVE